MEHTHNESHHEGHKEPHNDTHHAHQQAASKLKAHAGAFESWLLPLFSNLPHLPEGGRKVVTDIIPWLSLIFGVLGIIGLLGSGMVGMIFSPLVILGGGFSGIILLLTIVLAIACSVFSILAFKPLQAMKKTGWDYLFYALCISTVSMLIGMIAMMGGIGSVIFTLIGAYLLFEIRARYH